ALRFGFACSNNVAEYEALLSGLRMVKHLGGTRVIAHTDSQLVANQYSGEYEAREPLLARYLEEVKTLSNEFDALTVLRVPRSENAQADALSKLVSTSVDGASRTVLVQELATPSIGSEDRVTVFEFVTQASWMAHIINFKAHGQLPQDPKEARQVKARANQFRWEDGVLYRLLHTPPPPQNTLPPPA